MGISLCSPKTADDFNEVVLSLQKSKKKTASSFFDELEELIKEWTKFTNENLDRYHTIQQNYYSLILNKEIIKMANLKFREAVDIQNEIAKNHLDEENDSNKESLLNKDANKNIYNISTTNVAGVIDKIETERLRRLIFRATRGKAICITEDIDKIILEKEGINTSKTMYLMIFQSGDFMNARVRSICDSFLGETFELPSTEEYHHRIASLTQQINESKEVMGKTKFEIKSYFEMVNRIKNSEFSSFKVYERYIRKDMIIYQTMNKLVPENQLLHGFFWSDLPDSVAQDKIHTIQQEHRFEGLQALDMTKEVNMKPPTKIATNEFLEPFQMIVNTYGVPSYKEVNPALFTIVTFPFLFGVMFGDLAHGGLLFLFATYLIFYKEDIQKSASVLKFMLSARYLLLLMGFFAAF